MPEGPLAGTAGAVTVAAWFLLLDTIAGHPFYTPSSPVPRWRHAEIAAPEMPRQ